MIEEPHIRYVLANGEPLPPALDEMRRRREDIHREMFEALAGPEDEWDRSRIAQLGQEYRMLTEAMERGARAALGG